ncbi:MAG: molybdenum cofactor guanylyltransferase [Desulfopila sp.]
MSSNTTAPLQEHSAWRPSPVWGCLLIGGESRRMGRPKHLIEDTAGVTWIERIAACLAEVCDQVILSGNGEVPDSLAHLDRLGDIHGAQGPLAGILAALRWKEEVSWLVAACDMPCIHRDALRWLLSMRRAGVWGTVPLHPSTKKYEPLLAHYEADSRTLFERLLQTGCLRPGQICQDERIITPEVPWRFAPAWRNCNTPEDIQEITNH